MPSLPIVLKLSQFADFSSHDFGKSVRELVWLQQYVPVPATLLIPAETLERVLISDHAVLKLKQLLSKQKQTQTSQERAVQSFIQKLVVPEYLIAAIHSEYREYLHNQPVTLRATHQKHHHTIRTVSGAASVLVAIKELWAELLLSANQRRSTANLAPAGILIQAASTKAVHGTIASYHLGGIHKSAVVIQAQTSNRSSSEVEEYQVDIRSLTVVVRPHTNHHYQRQHQPKTSILNDAQCRELAAMCIACFQHKLGPLVLHWSLTESGFVFTEPLHAADKALTTPSKPKRAYSATQVFVTANSVSRMAAAAPLTDGIGPIASRYLVHGAGLHPVGALHHQASRAILKQNIQQTLLQLSQVSQAKSLFYTLYSAPRAQREKLLHAETETALADDLSTVTGAQYLLEFPQWLQFELETISEVANHVQSSLNIVLPDVKTPAELAALQTILAKTALRKQPHVSFWMEVATPAAALGLSAFPLHTMAGIVVSYPLLLQRMSALTPSATKQPEFDELSAIISQNLCSTIAKEVLTHTNGAPPKVLVVTDSVTEFLIRKIVGLGWFGISTQPGDILSLRSTIQAAERLVVDHKL